MKTISRLSLALLIAGTLVAAGCSRQAGSRQVQADLDEWTITLDTASVAAGDVTITARNVGTLTHEVVILRTDLAPEALVLEDGRVDEDASGTVIGEIEDTELPAGATATATFHLEPGAYVLFCNLPGHYQSGMTTGLLVTGS